MKMFSIALTSLLLTAPAFAVRNGDVFSCFDDVSFQTYVIRIENLKDQRANVTILKNKKAVDYYPHYLVSFVPRRTEFAFGLYSSRTREVLSEVFVRREVDLHGRGEGLYADHGDSRVLDCEKR